MAGRRQSLNERQQELQNLLQRRKDLDDAIRHLENLMKLREETPKAVADHEYRQWLQLRCRRLVRQDP